MRLRYILLLCVALLSAFAEPSKFGIVHGPKGAFNISAPKGWVIDNTAGSAMGCRASSIQKARRGKTRTR
jgi:hypothetical protein